jgi:DUF971 family protein
MSPKMVTPTEVGSVVEPALRIVWSDGHLSRYGWHGLRVHCPCAACKGEWTTRRYLDPASVPSTIRPLRIERVGAYALRPVWSDGHSTGIYPFNYLRHEICECEECVARRAAVEVAEHPTARKPE